MPYLIYKNDGRLEYVSLDNYSVFRIGRTSINEMTILDDKSISREHCFIFRPEDSPSYYLRDLNSRNGTYVNGDKVSDSDVPLNPGDRIAVGGTELIFSVSDPQFEDTTTSSGISKIELSHEVGREDEEKLLQTATMQKYPDPPQEPAKPLMQSILKSETLAPGTVISGYEIIRIIGSGQYSTVYLAFQKSVNRTVALKVFNRRYRSERALESFTKQIQIMGRLQHQNILPCFDGGTIEDLCYISMLYVSEGTLSDKIQNSAPLDEKYVLSIMKKCSDALSYALDEHGIIHLDIRPKNILFSDSGESMVSELGLSSWFTWAYQMNRNNYLGNPSYTSPEQSLDQSLDWKADQYTLGIIFYECFAGKVPFQADNAYNLIAKHRTEPIVFPGQISISDETKSIILQMTAKNPGDRFSSWPAISNAVETALKGGEPKLKQVQAPPQNQTPKPPLPAFQKTSTAAPPLRMSAGAVSQQKKLMIPVPKKKFPIIAPKKP